MARIPDVEIECLRKEVAIERLVMGFDVEWKRHGAELIGMCPFHDDVGGSTIDWVMKTKGVSFLHAVELLRTDHSS